MPTYEYECDACGHRFEDFQQMSDAPLKSCPKCRKRKLRRLIGSGGGADFQGHRLLPDRLSLEAIQRRQVQGRSERGARGVRHEEMRLVPEERSLEEQGMTDGTHSAVKNARNRLPPMPQGSSVPQDLRSAVLSLLQRALQAAGPRRLARRKAPDPRRAASGQEGRKIRQDHGISRSGGLAIPHPPGPGIPFRRRRQPA